MVASHPYLRKTAQPHPWPPLVLLYQNRGQKLFQRLGAAKRSSILVYLCASFIRRFSRLAQRNSKMSLGPKPRAFPSPAFFPCLQRLARRSNMPALCHLEVLRQDLLCPLSSLWPELSLASLRKKRTASSIREGYRSRKVRLRPPQCSEILQNAVPAKGPWCGHLSEIKHSLSQQVFD